MFTMRPTLRARMPRRKRETRTKSAGAPPRRRNRSCPRWRSAGCSATSRS